LSSVGSAARGRNRGRGGTRAARERDVCTSGHQASDGRFAKKRAAEQRRGRADSGQDKNRIVVVRELKVIIDADLALLYGVPTKRLNEQVKRNAERFPRNFMFALSAAEKAEVVANCDHLGMLKFSRSMPYAFTEHGAIQAANVLASPRAVEMGIYVVRAFVRLKAASASYAELAQRLAELEDKSQGLALDHDAFSRDTRAQLKQVFDALRATHGAARDAQAADRVRQGPSRISRRTASRRRGWGGERDDVQDPRCCETCNRTRSKKAL
jgi:ORF6N domain